MSPDKAVKARELLERGAYQEAATAFIAVGEYASAARAYVCSKAYPQAAECYEKAGKLLDAGRLYLQVREWQKAADLYTKAGDTLRADLALQWRWARGRRDPSGTSSVQETTPRPHGDTWRPEGR